MVNAKEEEVFRYAQREEIGMKDMGYTYLYVIKEISEIMFFRNTLIKMESKYC